MEKILFEQWWNHFWKDLDVGIVLAFLVAILGLVGLRTRKSINKNEFSETLIARITSLEERLDSKDALISRLENDGIQELLSARNQLRKILEKLDFLLEGIDAKQQQGAVSSDKPTKRFVPRSNSK